MRWLNYHHLLYFYTVAREGSVTRACKELRLAQPTVSAQLKSLEDSLGEKLFEKEGRYLRLTEVGQLVYRYADEIFGVGRELMSALEGRPSGRMQVLRVGIVDVMPKQVVYRLLEPVYASGIGVKLICREDHTEKLLAELALHDVDLVISDTPIPPTVKIKAYNHFLGECGTTFLASEKLAKQYSKGFPQSLDKAPLFLPSHGAAIRRDFDYWFQTQGVTPNVIGEFQDSALMKSFARAGHAIIATPTCVEKDVANEYGLHVVGQTDGVKERFYVISVERKVKHSAVLSIVEEAQRRLLHA